MTDRTTGFSRLRVVMAGTAVFVGAAVVSGCDSSSSTPPPGAASVADKKAEILKEERKVSPRSVGLKGTQLKSMKGKVLGQQPAQ